LSFTAATPYNDDMKVIAVVGMAGSGKSEIARFFNAKGYTTVRFGEITDEAVRQQGLPLIEENERPVRERIRREHGMEAYAKLSVPKIDNALKSRNVVVDGLYSWEEYIYLKDYYKDQFMVVAVWASPQDRYKRLGNRKNRPLTLQQAVSRDRAEIENLNKGGPICMADFTILNTGSISDLKKQVERIAARLR
jgi:dephospho-CoA kinase